MPSVWNLLSAWLAALASVLVLVGNAPSEAPIRALPVASSDATANDFLEEFTGAPSEPQPFASDSWAVNVASRDPSTWVNLNPMTAQHGSGCEGPTHTHTVTAYDDAVFLCNDHVMTAMNAEGYGVIYLTPNALVDFSEGTASVSFDVSTFRNSGRDFIGLWVTAYDDNLALPYNPGEGDVDLQGAPHNAVHFELDRGCSGFRASAFVNGREMLGHTGCWELPTWYEVLTPDSARRDTIELLISRDHVKLWMPDYGLVLAKADVALDFTQGVIQLGHHSYTPKKDCGIANSAMDASACGPTTWHWDNVAISPAVPFEMNHGNVRMVVPSDEAASTPPSVTFDGAAVSGDHLRFSAVGTVEVSFDGGGTWAPARKQRSVLVGKYHPEHASSYWHLVPAGATSAQFRFAQDDWYEGPYHARDFVIWSR